MKTKGLLAAGWLLAGAFCLSCGRQEVTAVLDRAETFMQEQPDSSLHLLRALDGARIPGASHKARYALLYSQALDKNYIDVDNDSLIRVAVDYYKRRGDAHQKALAYFYLGRVYDNAGDETLATEAFVEAETHALQTDDHYICGLIYSYLGNLYFAQYSFDEALDMYDKSEKCYARTGQLRNEGYMIEAKARVYNLLEDKADCYLYYEKAIDHFCQIKDTNYASVLNRDYALVQIQFNDYDKVSKDEINNTLSSCNNMALKGLVCLKENDLETAHKIIHSELDNNVSLNPKQRAGLNVLLSQIAAKQSRYKDALQYLQCYSTLMDSIGLLERQNLIQKIEKRYNNTLLRNKLVAETNYHSYQMKLVSLMITFGVIVFLYAIFLLVRKRKRMEKKKDSEIKTYKIMADDLASNYAELKSLYDRLSLDRDHGDATEARFIHALDSRMRGLGSLLEEAYLFENKPERFLRTFKDYVRESSAKDFAFSDLRYVVNKKHYGIIDYLKKTYPDLTESDLDLCSMICFGFSANSIRQIYAHTNPDSIYNKRSKLRNKMKLDPSIQIEGFIRCLLAKLSSEV